MRRMSHSLVTETSLLPSSVVLALRYEEEAHENITSLPNSTSTNWMGRSPFPCKWKEIESGSCKEALLTLISKSARLGAIVGIGAAVAEGAVGEASSTLGLGMVVSPGDVQAVIATTNAAPRIANASARLIADVQCICFGVGVRRSVWGQNP